ncbi:MAG: GNAT family N-acetyltransferase, partial [Firmicutes bacterium]|nr:GNAT family N-acetyltransferase [Bacillota bacterium]
MTVTTERLILRPFEASDEEDVFEYLKAPTVHCFYDMKLA